MLGSGPKAVRGHGVTRSPQQRGELPGFAPKPGSWYLDRSRPGHHELLYFPRPAEDMRQARVVAPVLESLVTGTGGPAAPSTTSASAA